MGMIDFSQLEKQVDQARSVGEALDEYRGALARQDAARSALAAIEAVYAERGRNVRDADQELRAAERKLQEALRAARAVAS